MVVYQSDIYAFNTLDICRENVPLFMAYMASEPVEYTMHMHPVEEDM
jgi:hypothetical protein